MRNVLMAIGLLFWCFGAFLVTFWLTFPSDEIGDRIRVEVPARLGAEYTADLSSASPWWLGISVRDLKLYRRTFEGGSEIAVPAAIFDRVRVALSPWSLVRRSAYYTGALDFPEGSLWYQVGTKPAGRGGGVEISDLVLTSDQVPIGDLLAVAGAAASVTGSVQLALDVHAGEAGMRDGSGSLSLSGEGLTISNIETMMGPLGMDIPVDRLDVAGEIASGRLDLTRGILASAVVTLEFKGSILLKDDLERSSVDVEVVVSNLGEDLKPFEGMMGPKGSDGAYHFYCRGTLDRMTASSCSSSRSAATSRVGSPRARTPIGRPDVLGGEEVEGGEPPTAGPMSADERRRRREERREELRKRREERLAAATGKGVAPAPDADEDLGPPPGDEPDPDEVPEDQEIEVITGDELDDLPPIE